MRKKLIVTHSGSFHADDLFAVATITMLLGKKNVDIKRTRDEREISAGDYVIDVGGVYDESSLRFDHHQPSGAGVHQSAIPYASFGLVWKYCGEKICGSKEVASTIERKLVEPIDANDNGIDLVEYRFPNTKVYLLQDFLSAFTPTWKEDSNLDDIFIELLDTARDVIGREIIHAVARAEAEKYVEDAYAGSSDKRLIILDGKWPWKDTLDKYNEAVYVVSEDREGNWYVQSVRKTPGSFENRKDLPQRWAGKKGRELAEISGVPDAIFCHSNLFVAYARSREGAIELAKKALNQ